MKIAVLIFGRIDKAAQRHNALFQSIGCEHTIDVFLSSDDPPNSMIQEFVGLYKPISYVCDKITDTYDLSRYTNTYSANHFNMTRHFVNKKRVFALLERHIETSSAKYDIILATRIDMSFHQKMPLELPVVNTIYVPEEYDYFGLNDRLAYGDFNTMKHYMNIYDNMMYLLDNGYPNPHPETLTLANITHYGIQVKRFPYSTEVCR